MKIDVIPARQLSADHLAAWSHMQRTEPTLANPFFRPEFTQAVAAERDDVQVAVWEQGGEPVAFFPFQRSSKRLGRPVGSHLNQCQGGISRAGVDWSPADAIRAAGLRGWQFDHLAGTQQAFAPYQYVRVDSPYLDLSQGFDHYWKGRGKSASVFISHIFQKDRKAGRDLGDVRIELESTNRKVLQQLLEWKTEQCRRTYVPCAFDLDWVVRVLERMLDHDTDEFKGMLFSLYMGDRLTAAMICVRSGNLLHGSVLGYDRDLGRYAPGFVLVMRMAKLAITLGVTRVDMGSGGEVYKDKLASGCDQVAEGTVPARALLAPVYRGLFRTKDRLRATRLRTPVRAMRAWMLATRARLGYSD